MSVLHFIFLYTFVRFVYSQQYHFPHYFKFGVASSAYQTEGAWNEKGKGPSIWDKFTHENIQLIHEGTNADVASDSYHKFKEDVEQIAWLGVDFYRFSLSWSRLLPSGYANEINQDGVRYYNQLIDALIARNVTPMVTLYHWDLPQSLQDIGGWSNPMMVKYFEDYARVAFKLFGGRVKVWLTFNEPLIMCVKGYGEGTLAPGVHGYGIGEYMCGHTVLLAHARVYHRYDKHFRPTQQGKIGIAILGEWIEPRTNSSEDWEAAERLMQFRFEWWSHPIFSKSGNYPQTMINRIARISKEQNFTRTRLPPFSKKQVKHIRGTSDFLGLNYYTTSLVQSISDSSSMYKSTPDFFNDVGVQFIDNPKWPKPKYSPLRITPWSFRKMLSWIKRKYGDIEVIVTENGYADNGILHDSERISFIQDYLQNLLEAIHEDKCNVVGYTYWSLLDNFEWTAGYKIKFGLFYVNFTDPLRTRVAKDSATAYKSIIASRRIK